MLYKGYTLSKSLYGTKIYHIARNSSRVVVLRDRTEEELKKAIDKRIKLQEEEKLAKEKEKLVKEAKKKRGLFEPKVEIQEKVSPVNEVEKKEKPKGKVLIGSAATDKPLLENDLRKQVEAVKKTSKSSEGNKSFWDRLK